MMLAGSAPGVEEVGTWSAGAAADLLERAAVSTLWKNVEPILSGGSGMVDTSLRWLTGALPDLEALSVHQLPQLARLHVRSASDLMAAVRLVAPAVFPKGAAYPDVALLPQLSDDVAGMVSSLIDLQLFHLHRAAQLTAYARKLLSQSLSMSQSAFMHNSSDADTSSNSCSRSSRSTDSVANNVGDCM